MNNRWLVIKQLDKQLKEWQTVSKKYGRPKFGWIKTIRKALNMSAQQFANRLGLTRARIIQLEKAEIQNAITVRSLKEAANAMECEFVYAIIPKGNSTLEDIIKIKIKQLTIGQIERIAHSMALEDQTLDKHFLKNQKNEFFRSALENIDKKIWDIKNLSDHLNQIFQKKLLESQQKKK